MSVEDDQEQKPKGYWGLLLRVALVVVALVTSCVAWNVRTGFKHAVYLAYPEAQGQKHSGNNADNQTAWIDRREAWYADGVLDVYVFQLILGIAGIGGVGLTVFYAHQAWSEAKRSAEIANKSLSHARDASKRELRAYVAVVPVGVHQLIGRKATLGQVELRNVGKLPATKVFLVVHSLIDKRTRTDFPVPGREPTDNVIHPTVSVRKGSRDEIDISEIVGADRAAKLHMFVYGIVYYEDGYGRPCWTRFCHRYNLASYNRSVDWRRISTKARTVLDADKARYQADGNDAT